MIQCPKNEFLDTALKAAKSAAHLIQHSTKNYVTNYKSESDLVTKTDIESEKIISDIIKSKFEFLQYKNLTSSSLCRSILSISSGSRFSHSPVKPK